MSFVKEPMIQRLSFILCFALMGKAPAVVAGESKSETASARKPSGIYAVVIVQIYEEDVLHATEHDDVQRILLDVKDKLARLNRGS